MTALWLAMEVQCLLLPPDSRALMASRGPHTLAGRRRVIALAETQNRE